MTAATADEIAELLGERAEESIVDRIAHLGASVDEVYEAIADLEFQLRFDEERAPSSPRVKEIRTILEELPYVEDVLTDPDEDDDEHEGLSVIEGDDLNPSK
jgi:hypothetical protein